VPIKYIAALAAFLCLMAFSWHQGAISERVKWQTRENAQQAAYNAKTLETEAKHRAIENKRAVDAQNLSVSYLKSLKETEDAKNRIIADLRAGIVKLRGSSGTNPTCRITVPEASTDSSGTNGTPQAELSTGFSEYLVNKFDSADKKVILLNRCIDQLHADREGQ